MMEIDSDPSLELPDQVFEGEDSGSLSRISDPIELKQTGHYLDTAGQCGVAIFLLQIVRPLRGAPHPVFDPVSKTPQPRRTQIGGIVGQPAHQRRRSAEVVAVTRRIRREPRVGPADQLRFIRAVVFPGDRNDARMLGHSRLEKRQRYIPVRVVDVVDPPIPGPAPEIMIKPLDQGARQRRLRATDQRFELAFELTEIVFLVKGGSTGLRIELTVKGPEDLTRGIIPVEQIEKVAPDLAPAAIERHGIAVHSASALRAFGSVCKNAAPGISVGRKKIVIGDGPELAWGKGKLLVLVDDFEGKTFSLGDSAGQVDVLVAGRAIHIDPRADSVTAEQRQDEPRVVAAGKSAGDAFTETSRDRREIAVEQLHALLDRRLERLAGECRWRREPAGPDFQTIFAHRNRRAYRCEQHLVKHCGIAGHHAVEDVFASALSAQSHVVKDRSYCQERGRRDASRLIVKNEKATKAVRQDFGLTVLVQDNCIMA